MTAEIGSASSAIKANCHEITNIIAPIPSTVSIDCTSCENVRWSTV